MLVKETLASRIVEKKSVIEPPQLHNGDFYLLSGKP